MTGMYVGRLLTTGQDVLGDSSSPHQKSGGIRAAAWRVPSLSVVQFFFFEVIMKSHLVVAIAMSAEQTK